MSERFITREDIAKMVGRNLGISQDDALAVFNESLKVLHYQLASGRQVSLRGFGRFTVKPSAQRYGRNPSRGGESDWYEIPAHSKAQFIPSTALKQAVRKVPIPQGWKGPRR